MSLIPVLSAAEAAAWDATARTQYRVPSRVLMEAAGRSGITVNSLSVQSTTLDDVFVYFTGRALRDGLQEASAADSPFMIRRQ